ncbi:hypothetical protein KC323_g254 [Hortaea werneckii]|nr:hypothetical protein KC323_g254 [Hortaea werneckii]KAI7360154.1 hypothetical protein KC320_g201 [Hortaea werneckii]
MRSRRFKGLASPAPPLPLGYLRVIATILLILKILPPILRHLLSVTVQAQCRGTAIAKYMPESRLKA